MTINFIEQINIIKVFQNLTIEKRLKGYLKDSFFLKKKI